MQYYLSDSNSILKSLLLFDKLFYSTQGLCPLYEMLLNDVLGNLDIFNKKMKQIEELEKRNLIQNFEINKIKPTVSIEIDEEMRNLSSNAIKASLDIEKAFDFNNTKPGINPFKALVDTIESACHHNSRAAATILNRIDLQNEYIPTFRKFLDLDPQCYAVKKHDIIQIILKKFPIISDDISIEQIIEFKSDSDTKLRYFELIDFITNISYSKFSIKEIEEKIEFLLHQYKTGLELQKIKYNTSILETFCITSLQIIENLAKLKFSDAIKPIFDLTKKKINLIEAERQLKGRELSYIIKIGENL